MGTYGAVRLYLHGRLAQERGRKHAELPPIREGRWAAWAHGEEDDHSLTDHPCRLPDGSIGRVAVVLQGRHWVLVCRVA